MKWNVGKSQRRESHNKPGSRELNKKNQNEGCQVQKGISSQGKEPTWCLLCNMGSRKAHAGFYCYFSTC